MPTTAPFVGRSDSQDTTATFDAPASLLARYAQTRDPRLRDRLVSEHQGLVYYVAHRFANRGEPFEDLVQVGNIGLINALERYRASEQTKFTTFALPTITGEIKRYFRDKVSSVKIPRSISELSYQIDTARSRLQARLLRPPRPAEIAAEIGVSEEAVLEAIEARAAVQFVTSLDAQVQSDQPGAEFGRESVGECDPMFELIEDRADLAQALSRLDDRDRRVLHQIYYEGLNQSEIARQMGISQMHVSRLQRRALRRMRQMLSWDMK